MHRIGAHQDERAERNADRGAEAHDADLALVGDAQRGRDEADREHRVGDQQQRRGDLRIGDGCGERQEDQRGAEAREAARQRGDEGGRQQEGERAGGEIGREEVGHGRFVMPGLVPGIRVFLRTSGKTWMAGHQA